MRSFPCTQENVRCVQLHRLKNRGAVWCSSGAWGLRGSGGLGERAPPKKFFEIAHSFIEWEC
jgi:hypothetical protein